MEGTDFDRMAKSLMHVYSTDVQPKCSVPIETEHRTVRDSTTSK